MNRRRFRIGIGLSAGAAVVLIAVVVVAPMLVPREKLRRLAEQEVATLTGGDVSLGSVSLRVLPRIRLVLGASSVEVTRDGLVAAGQDPGPLLTGSLTLEKLEVDLAIGPLLRRRLEFGEIHLVAPRIALVTEVVDSAAAAGQGASISMKPCLRTKVFLQRSAIFLFNTAPRGPHVKNPLTPPYIS